MTDNPVSQHPLDGRLPGMLASGRTLRGIFNGLPSPAIVEMCAYAGFDFVIIDNEHGSADLQTTEHMLRAARASGIVPIVRCFEADIPRVLDMGASGVQVPMVETPEQAARLAQPQRAAEADHRRHQQLQRQSGPEQRRHAGRAGCQGDDHQIERSGEQLRHQQAEAEHEPPHIAAHRLVLLPACVMPERLPDRRGGAIETGPDAGADDRPT